MKTVFTLLHHQWLSFWRSRGSGKNFAVQIVLGIFLLYFLFVAIVLGMAMPEILQKYFPHRNAITQFCRFILYYFFMDLIFRFMMQELPILSIESYLTKNIQKKILLRFLNFRALFHFLNIVPLLLFLPFSFHTILKQYGWTGTFGFDISILALILFNQYLIAYIKRKSIVKSSWLFGMVIVVVLLGFLDIKNIISIRSFSSWIFLNILAHPLLCIAPTLLATIALTINNRYLYNNLYLDELSKKEKNVKNSTEYNWLNKYGEIGDLIGLEIKLIARNKRAKSVVMISCIFLFYGFLFYKPEVIEKNQLGMLLLWAFFITGAPMLNFGGFLFAWNSGYMDTILTSKISIKDYIKSKIYLLSCLTSIAFLVSNLYGFISWKIILIQLAAFAFNIGVNIILLAYISTFNYKYIDISQKAMMNYSGTGIVQWVYNLALFILPLLLYCFFYLVFNSWAGIAAIGITGALSLLFQRYWINFITKEFNKRKYLIAEGFREK